MPRRPDEEDFDPFLDDMDGGPPDPAAPRPVLVDDRLLSELEDLADEAFGQTLDEFVLDPSVFADAPGSDFDADGDLDHGEPEPGDLPILPWSCRAVLPEHGLELPAVLDPTAEASEWTVTADFGSPRVRVLVVIGKVRGPADLVICRGDEPGLRLGRDWLAGRANVRSKH